MAVTIIGAAPPQRGTGLRVKQTWSQSTATAFQTLATVADLYTLGVGTATGFTRNRYALASGVPEGQEAAILTTGTGEANLYVAGTATGLHVFTEADDFLKAIYWEGKWRILISSATLASGT